MKRDVRMPSKDFSSSFLSCEKDIEEVLKKLFVTSKPYSETLKRLLVINTKDCLDNEDSDVIKNKLSQMNLAALRKEGYIKLEPKIKMEEHAEVKSYIIISCDNFYANGTNPYYRDCIINFDIICHTDCWDLGDYRIRPLKIAGYIDGILNGCKLSGIGVLNFMGCSQLILNETLSGYTLAYQAIHGNDDNLPAKD